MTTRWGAHARGRVGVAIALIALAVTACGSTVPPSALNEALQNPAAGLGQVPGAPGSTVAPGTPGLGSPLAPGATAPGVGPTAIAPGSGAPPVAAFGPGITPSNIYVAVAYTDAGSANQATFGTPLDADFRKPYRAMIKEVNEAGGVFGRDVVPLFYKFSADPSKPIDQQAQAACAHWTQDNKVFVFFAADASGILQRCAEQAGAVMVLTGANSFPEDFVKYPHYVESSGINVIRMGDVTVKGLVRENYFDGTVKLGVVLWDEPTYRAALERGYEPALARHGLELGTEPAYVTPPQTLQDLAEVSSDINSAVLRFQTEDVTHVMILDGSAGLCAGGCLTTLFLKQADNQQWRPPGGYGFNGNNQAKGLYDAGLLPASQLKDMIDVEWADYDAFYDEGYRLNEDRERCYALMRRHGVPMENGNQRYGARAACEHLWLLQDVEARLGATPLYNDSFMAGVNALAWSVRTTNAYEAHLSATQHDGLAAARNMRFGDGCQCFQWISKPYRV